MGQVESTHYDLTRQILHGSNTICKNCPIEKTEFLTDGLINISIRSCHQPPECNPVIVNLFLNDSHDRLEQEAYIRELCVSEPNLPLQRLIRTGSLKNNEGDDVNYIVKEYKPGDTFHQILTNHENLIINNDDFSRMLNQLGRYLSMIHKIRHTAFGKISGRSIVGPNESCSWKEYYQHQLKRMFNTISSIPSRRKVGDLRAEEVKGLLPVLFKLVDKHDQILSQVQEAQLVHHDFHFLNIIADDRPEWSITGILDTENATFGDPAIDLVSIESHLFLSKEQYGGVFEKNISNFREGYTQNVQIPYNYSQRRILYHIPWSLSYFQAVFNIDTELHPITPQIVHYAKRHFSIIQGLADGQSLEEIGVFSIF